MGETLEQRIARVVKEHVAVVPYDPRWPRMFEEERERLLSCLPNDLVRRIEHFGSTAVPGLAAKPIVDVLVEVTDAVVTRLACVLLLLVPLASRPATADEPAGAETQPMPGWAAAVFERSDFAGQYALSTRLDPSLLHGDFDGDGRLDVAALVSRRATGASGIAILHAGAAKPLVVGAGHPLGNGGDDFSWMDAWSVVARASLDRGDREPRAPRPRGDAILVEKREAASALVYWDGAAYRWRQQGD